MRGRFAPSPSGALHLGHISTALLSWLQAHSMGGEWWLRMEDNDPQRSKSEHMHGIRRDLAWLGLHWDVEGPLQSDRHAAYAEALDVLTQQGLVFACQCTRKDMEEAVRASDQSWGSYPGTCLHAHLAMDGPYALRLHHSEDAFVLRRADGAWAYQLAVVVDDQAQNITHVLRGQDLVNSQAPQTLLHQKLGGAPPKFNHAPLWLGPDGVRLSKRHHARSVQDYRLAGWSPNALLGHVACALGYLPEPTPCVPKDLLPSFVAHPLRQRAIAPSEVLPLWV